MPRQNTSPSDFPAAIRQQITQLAQRITTERKHRGATQVQWAEQLGISQPTMARLERGDPAVSMATYVACLTLIHPALDLAALLPDTEEAKSKGATASIATGADTAGATSLKTPQNKPLKTLGGGETTTPPQALTSEQQALVAQRFAAAKAALDAFKSPGF